MTQTALDHWRRYAESGGRTPLWEFLDPEVVFESPIVHTPQRGREITARYLACAVQVLGGPAFRFVEEWRNDRGGVLELETKVDGIRIDAIDIITLSEDGQRIVQFKVMVRPLKAIQVLGERMAAALAAA